MREPRNAVRARSLLDEENLDAIVVEERGFSAWLTSGPYSAFGSGVEVVVTRDGVYIVTHLLEYWRLSRIPGVELKVYTRSREAVESEAYAGEKLVDALRLVLDGARRVGCVGGVCGRLREMGFEAIDVSEKLWRLRMVKEDWELERMSEAARIALRALASTPLLLREGVSELEVAAEHERLLRLYGSEGHAFAPHGSLTIVAFGANTAYPHWEPSGDARLEPGTPVLIDTGAVYRGYVSDLTRVYWFPGRGRYSFEKWKNLVEAVAEAVWEAFDSVEPGVEAWVVDQAARKALGGYAKWFIHSTGHGLGVEVHEPPRIAPGSKTRLEPGMVFTIEPGVYLRGEMGVRIEYMVVVGERGARLLGSAGESLGGLL